MINGSSGGTWISPETQLTYCLSIAKDALQESEEKDEIRDSGIKS